ncbi:MAG: lipid A biosynthesis lauroyl acyltransferase, partial [Alphaproteobacteria bacterium]|nr:lipid A biosynthesis lauroyl acyltransferase [Alphaproteobacteria bacterium]
MIGFYFFLLFDWLVMKIPRTIRKKLFFALASLAHKLAGKRNRIIQANLNFAFGDALNLNEKKEIESYCYQNLALNLLQVMENKRNTTEDLAKQVTFENTEMVDLYLSQNRPLIFISAHHGNWEIGAASLAALITPITSIYKGLDNDAFNPYLLEARSRHRLNLIEKNGAIKHLARALKNNQCVSLLIDQSSNAKSGIKVNFFNHPTYHTSAAAQLSRKYNAPIIGLYIYTEDEENYVIRFVEPIEVEGDDEQSILNATQRQVDDLEKVIRDNPKFWFWCHKRWK